MILNENTQKSLEQLAGVKEFKTTGGIYGRIGVEFDFMNSTKANYAKIVEYHDRFIMQLRKKGKDPLSGKETDQLVFEDIVKEQEISKVFEQRTGISINYYQEMMR